VDAPSAATVRKSEKTCTSVYIDLHSALTVQY